METKKQEIKKASFEIFKWLVTILLVGFLISYPIMWLWNGLFVPSISCTSEINVFQAWGISVLSRLIFTSQGPH